MQPKAESKKVLGITRSKAKMYEYSIPDNYHIKIQEDPARLLRLAIGIVGDFSANLVKHADHNEDIISEDSVNFSAHFFDAYVESRLSSDLDNYIQLVGSAAYYLCGLPGSSAVLARNVDSNVDLEASGIEKVLAWLLKDGGAEEVSFVESHYASHLEKLTKQFRRYYSAGFNESDIRETASALRVLAYAKGTPRQLLLADILGAVVRKKLVNSCRHSLPIYSGIPPESWETFFKKREFIRELWPSQHLLGKEGVLSGTSAVVQMPTSAGKTKGLELVIRSAFLANRTKIAVVIAPFRALCHEIRNSLDAAFRDEPVAVSDISDVLQADLQWGEEVDSKRIVVMTPEKLLYSLRHDPSPAADFGLVIFDEAHQFDSGSRGITYELLLTALKRAIPVNAQKVLVSAVMENARAVADWFNGSESAVVAGTNLIPTYRSVGFTSWTDQLGRIQYVSNEDTEREEFFVPRVIESRALPKKPRERNTRQFPDKTDGNSIALYLGFHLVRNGSVAIYCGRKATAATICELAVDIHERGVKFFTPDVYADENEIEQLHYLYSRNLGTDSVASRGAQIGVFSHHGNVPDGIRISVEHAMREELISFVICTSTLAQGVNLPLRYLIVTSLYQGRERIKVRDFHNLIGRAGRAGMHTEGSVLFADPAIFDRRKAVNEKWRWKQVKHLLLPRNSEPCISNLLSLFEPFTNDSNDEFDETEVSDFINRYIRGAENPDDLARIIVERNVGKGFKLASIIWQVTWKIELIGAVESFLLANWDLEDKEFTADDATKLAEETLAFSLADEATRIQIRNLFVSLSDNIKQTITEPHQRKSYSQTLLNIRTAAEAERWVKENFQLLSATESDEDVLKVIWPFLQKTIKNKVFRKCDNPEILHHVAQAWIDGTAYYEIMSIFTEHNARLKWGRSKRKIKIEDIVDACESGLGFEGSLLVGAISKFLPQGSDEILLNRILTLQKRLTYGLPSLTSIRIYEMGLSDRCVAQDLEVALKPLKLGLIASLKLKRGAHVEVLSRFPSYFRHRVNELQT